jgi:hypothetical protein
MIEYILDLFNDYCFTIDLNAIRKRHPSRLIHSTDTEHTEHTVVEQPIISCYFDNIETRLIEHINQATYVIGCAAWLTNKTVINSLKSCSGVKIIINREEYLDRKSEAGSKQNYVTLRKLYRELPDLFESKCKCCNKKVSECTIFNDKIMSLGPSDVVVDDGKYKSILAYGFLKSHSKLHHKFLLRRSVSGEATKI